MSDQPKLPEKYINAAMAVQWEAMRDTIEELAKTPEQRRDVEAIYERIMRQKAREVGGMLADENQREAADFRHRVEASKIPFPWRSA